MSLLTETKIFFSVKNGQDWTGGMVQVVERLPSKHEAQSSNPNARKKEWW
jgi:hypothetical protein